MITAWVLTAAIGVASAGEQSAAPIDEASASSVRDDASRIRPRHQWQGRIGWRSIVYPLRVAADDARVAGWLTAEVTHRRTGGPFTWTAGLTMDLLTERGYQGPAIDLADRGPRKPMLSISDLSLRAAVARGVWLEAGRLHPRWAVTDGFSPIEAVLPRDLTDPFADTRLPIWAVRAETEHGPWRSEVFHAPLTTPWRLPPMTGRLSPGWYADVFLTDPVDRPPRRGFTIARVQTSVGSWDLSAWVRHGVRPAPIFDVDLEEASDPPAVRMLDPNRRFTTETAEGLGLTRVAAGWVLRGEVAHLNARDADVGRAVVWSIGADRPGRHGLMTVTVSGNALDTPVDPIALPDRAFLPYFVATSTQTEEWGDWTVTWLATLRRVGGVLTLGAHRQMSSTTSIAIGVDLPHGARSSSPGAISRARRGHLTLDWRW